MTCIIFRTILLLLKLGKNADYLLLMMIVFRFSTTPDNGDDDACGDLLYFHDCNDEVPDFHPLHDELCIFHVYDNF